MEVRRCGCPWRGCRWGICDTEVQETRHVTSNDCDLGTSRDFLSDTPGFPEPHMSKMTTENAEPLPIKRLQEALINRIAAGEACSRRFRYKAQR